MFDNTIENLKKTIESLLEQNEVCKKQLNEERETNNRLKEKIELFGIFKINIFIIYI